MTDNQDVNAPVETVATGEALPVEATNDTAPATPDAPETAAPEDDDAALLRIAAKLNEPSLDRDEAGRFKAKGEKPETNSPEPAEAAEVSDPAKVEASEPMPASWGKDKSEVWSKLPPEARAYIAHREEQVASGFRQYAERFQPLEAVQKAIEPFRETFEQYGIGAPEAVARLFQAEANLRRDPERAIETLAAQYGVDLRQKYARPETDEYVDPQIAELQARYDRLERQLANERAEQEQRIRQAEARQAQEASREAMSVVEAWKQKGDRAHFETVRADMARLLNAELATDLDDAYAKAVAMRPDLARAEAERAAREAEAKRQDEARKRADAARRATGINVKSDPSGNKPVMSEQEELMAIARKLAS